MVLSVLYGLVLIQVLIVAWVDFKTEKISNYWVILNLCVAPLLYIFLPSDYVFSWEIFIFPVGFVVGGFILFLMNIMGAGDSKYLASLFLILPLEFHLSFFEKLVISTILTGAILLAIRIFREGKTIKAYLLSSYWGGIKQILKSRFSYAPVILIAWILLGISLKS